jgi:CheY-like chemotaxis protein
MPEPAVPTPRRVLVVDDCHDTTASLDLLLRLWGYEVRVAHDGPAALAVLETYRPNTVLLDIGMPGMDGLQVARQVQQRPELRDVLLVSLSGYGQEQDRESSREAGCLCHLVKPVDPAVLQTVLASGKPPPGE